MRASSNAYKNVATHCSEYLPYHRHFETNCVNCEDKSCLKCRHFDNEKCFCKIDLYDRIAKNHRVDYLE